MHLFTRSSLLLLSLLSPNAFAGYESPSVKSVKIFKAFQLKRIDGRSVTLRPPVAPKLGALPAPTNADKSLCGPFKAENPDLVLRQTRHMLELSKLSRSLEGRTRLTASEIALIRSTPRCEPHLAFLQLIAQALGGPQEEEVTVEQLVFDSGFLKKGQLQLLLTDWIRDEGAKVNFALPGLSNWKAASISAAATGRGIGVRIQDLGEGSEPLEGGGSEGRASCTVSVPVKRCERRGECTTDYEDRPGYRYYQTSPVYYHRAWKITFTAANGAKLMEVQAETSRAEDYGDEGECRPSRRGRSRW